MVREPDRPSLDGGPAGPEPDLRGLADPKQGSSRITVFVVDDHDLFRSGVRNEISRNFEVTGEAADVDPAVEAIVQVDPMVVLIDVHLPSGTGAEVIERVKRERPAIRFLALSVSDAPADVISVIMAGARGYVTKAISGPDLVDAVQRVAAGDAVFSPRLAGFVLDAFSSEHRPVELVDPEFDQLSPREKEVLRLIARGYTYKEVGRELFISTKTVESHVSAVLRKLQLSTRHQLARWASERRIL